MRLAVPRLRCGERGLLVRRMGQVARADVGGQVSEHPNFNPDCADCRSGKCANADFARDAFEPAPPLPKESQASTRHRPECPANLFPRACTCPPCGENHAHFEDVTGCPCSCHVPTPPPERCQAPVVSEEEKIADEFGKSIEALVQNGTTGSLVYWRSRAFAEASLTAARERGKADERERVVRWLRRQLYREAPADIEAGVHEEKP